MRDWRQYSILVVLSPNIFFLMKIYEEGEAFNVFITLLSLSCNHQWKGQLMLPVICFYRLEITFDGDVMNGVACNLQSRGYHALCKATKEIVGHVEPYSITGSLPLIRELQV
jgi:hypothetical protein